MIAATVRPCSSVGEVGGRGHGDEPEPAVERVRSLVEEPVPGPHHLGRAVDVEEHRATHDIADRVGPEGEGGDDAEVAAASAKRPEQVRVPLGVRGDHGPVGQDDVGGEQAVDGQAELAAQVADPAAQGEAADAGGGDEAARHRQPERVGGVVDVAPAWRRPRPGRPARPGRRGRLASRERSTTSASSHTPSPPALWPPPRTARVRPRSPAVVDRGHHVGDVHAPCDRGAGSGRWRRCRRRGPRQSRGRRAR